MNEDKQNYFKVIEGTTLYYEHYVKYLQKQLKAYENMRKEAIEYIEHAKFIREQVILKRSYALQDFQVKDLLNILNKVGEDNE